MAIPTELRAARDDEFDAFVRDCKDHTGWSIVYEKGDDLKVWDQKSDKSAINTVKLYAVFKNIPASVMYDVLHDPEYRAVWDENMIEGYNVEQVDANNDVGYYAAKMPTGIANRDFCNQRSWRVKESKEYLIMNHTVIHPKCPEKKGFERANSIRTGYLVTAVEGGGCEMLYMTQTDPKGWIPAWVTNKVTKTVAPKIVEKLEHAAAAYNEWKNQHNPDNKPWLAGGK